MSETEIESFYTIAQAFHPGDAIWPKLDEAISNWRQNLCASLSGAASNVLHIGASRRADISSFCNMWPQVTRIHFVEGDKNGTTNLQPLAVQLSANGLNVSIAAVAISNKSDRLRLSRMASQSNRAVWVRDVPLNGIDGQILSEPVPALGLDDLGLDFRPDVIIFDDLGLVGDALLSMSPESVAGMPLIIIGTAEASWTPDQWNQATNRLQQFGYGLFDPTGFELPPSAHGAKSISWYAAAAPNGNRPAERADMILKAIREASDRFKIDVLGQGKMRIAAPAPFSERVEIVSLETAAMVSKSPYLSKEVDVAFFDIYSRKMVDRSKKVEAAAFESVTVLPGAMWKICVGKRWYVEELGYSAHGTLFGIENFPDWDGRRSVYNNAATIQRVDTPANAILFGGDWAYYHWILNWLPRLRAMEVIDDLVGKIERPHFIVSDRLPDKWFDYFALILGRPFDLTRVPERGVWQFNNVIVPSFCSSHELHPSISTWYRERLKIPSGRGGKRYYLSRKDARVETTPRRKVVNEVEVLSALEPFGFEPLLLGDADARTQIDIFSQADFVIGPHGAAFANMQFTPSGAKAIVLENEWAHTFMADMLKVAAHDADVLVCKDVINKAYEASHTKNGEVDSEIRRSRDMHVDIIQLVAKVRELLSHKG